MHVRRAQPGGTRSSQRRASSLVDRACRPRYQCDFAKPSGGEVHAFPTPPTYLSIAQHQFHSHLRLLSRSAGSIFIIGKQDLALQRRILNLAQVHCNQIADSQKSIDKTSMRGRPICRKVVFYSHRMHCGSLWNRLLVRASSWLVSERRILLWSFRTATSAP